MFRSMTGYGKANVSSTLGNFSLEIQSVNRKFLEININLPKELSFLTSDIRKVIETEVFSGQVSVNLRVRFEDKLPFKVVPNLSLAKELHLALQSIAKELKLDDKTVSLNTLFGERSDLLQFESQSLNDEEYKKLIHTLTTEALHQFISMREVEGNSLAEDFEKRLSLLEEKMGQVVGLAKNEPEKLRQKLLSKLQEAFPSSIENEERVMREMIIYCEKVDVQEEITRFYSHVKQFRTLLKGAPGGIGKKMDFLSQEIGRELNTLGSKSNDIQVSQAVVEMKTELSRIREQLQNVE